MGMLFSMMMLRMTLIRTTPTIQCMMKTPIGVSFQRRNAIKQILQEMLGKQPPINEKSHPSRTANL